VSLIKPHHMYMSVVYSYDSSTVSPADAIIDRNLMLPSVEYVNEMGTGDAIKMGVKNIFCDAILAPRCVQRKYVPGLALLVSQIRVAVPEPVMPMVYGEGCEL
jgi:hypothetical protein